jgi:hypothetical protein
VQNAAKCGVCLEREELKTPHIIQLKGTPPQLQGCFDLLRAAGAEHFALFGGAIRDADYAARHSEIRPAKDYDLRVWLPAEGYEHHLLLLIRNLGALSGVDIRETPSAGTGRIRYCLDYCDVELDVSVRPVPDVFGGKKPPAEAVARDRAADSDIGICSVAIDPLGQAWATPEYERDQTLFTLTGYLSADTERIAAYTARMQKKFPAHTVIVSENLPETAVPPPITRSIKG